MSICTRAPAPSANGGGNNCCSKDDKSLRSSQAKIQLQPDKSIHSETKKWDFNGIKLGIYHRHRLHQFYNKHKICTMYLLTCFYFDQLVLLLFTASASAAVNCSCCARCAVLCYCGTKHANTICCIPFIPYAHAFEFSCLPFFFTSLNLNGFVLKSVSYQRFSATSWQCYTLSINFPPFYSFKLVLSLSLRVVSAVLLSRIQKMTAATTNPLQVEWKRIAWKVKWNLMRDNKKWSVKIVNYCECWIICSFPFCTSRQESRERKKARMKDESRCE